MRSEIKNRKGRKYVEVYLRTALEGRLGQGECRGERACGGNRCDASPSFHPNHQAIYSPYMLGVSPRTNASNVLFRTADQSRSRLSSATLSIHSPSSSTAPAVVRAIRSPLANRGPRSGQCRTWSKGCHLNAVISTPAASDKQPPYQKLWKWYEKEPLKKPSNPTACGAALF